MEQRLRRSGFANFDLWSEISSCIEGWRLSSSCVYGEMFLENKNHLDMSQSMCRWSIMHIKSLFCVLVWVLKWTTTWSVGARQLAETVKNIINDPFSNISKSIVHERLGGCIEQAERPDFSNGSLHTLSRALLKAVFLTTDFSDVTANSSEVHI